jgi:hypothetical protein
LGGGGGAAPGDLQYKTWLNSQAADFFDKGIQKLIPQYDKCLNSGNGFVEKQLNYVFFVYNKAFFLLVLLILYLGILLH